MTPALFLLQARGAESAVGAGAEEIVLRLLYQLVVILVVTRIVTWIARRLLGQTDVSGEILAGILLGPSLLGAIAPEFMDQLFHKDTSTVFTGIAQVGLVLLMFQIGLEFEFRTHLGEDRKPIVAISIASLVVPFAAGYLAAPWFHGFLPEPRPPLFGFRLFFAVAMSITAIPILGRIFMELGLSHTRTAALTIGAAAINDVSGWLVLSALPLLLAQNLTFSWALPRVGGLALYLAAVFIVLRPLLKRAIARHLDREGGLSLTAIGSMLVLLFLSGAVTSNLGVFAIIGGFVIGAALHDDRRFVEEWKRRISPMVYAFFLPVFFTYTGLRTDIGKIGGWTGVGLCALVCLLAFATKFVASYVAARAVGEPRRSAATIGVCMNTRALMELIVINIGMDLGVLPKSMFTMLVVMAIASTFMATPLIRRLMRGQERAAGVDASRADSTSSVSE